MYIYNYKINKMIQEKYYKGVDKKQREKELKERKQSKKPLKELFPKKTDKEAIEKGIIKQSKFTKKFNELYPNLKFDKKLFSKKFNIKIKDLDEIYDKGIKAWKTAGSRPGVNAIAWGRARLYKFILAAEGKIKMKENDPDYKALQRVLKYNKGVNKNK